MKSKKKQKNKNLKAHDQNGNEYEVTFLNIEEVKPYERNPRNNDAAIEPLMNSIRRFGFHNPIIVDGSKTIICGHSRLKAAQNLGLKVVPVHVARGLSDDEVKAYRLADNRISELSTWNGSLMQLEIDDLLNHDFNINTIGFEDFDLNSIMEEQDPISDGQTNPEAIPDVPEIPQSVKGKIYKLGRHSLLCGDATNPEDMTRLLAGNSVDLWITDPPYNVDYSGKNEMLNRSCKGNSNQTPIKNDAMSDTAFQDLLNKSFSAAAVAMKPGACFYIFHADLNGIFFRAAVRECRLHLKQVLQWIKNNIVIGYNDYQWIHEPCLYGWKDGAPHYFSGNRKQRTVIEFEKTAFRKREDGKFEFRIGAKFFTISPDAAVEEEATTGLEFPKPQTSAEHPTMKPVALFVYLIRNSSRRGEKILDNFAGSGTTILAAEQTDRTAFCMELEPRYCDIIRKRWAEFVYGEGCAWEDLTPEI